MLFYLFLRKTEAWGCCVTSQEHSDRQWRTGNTVTSTLLSSRAGTMQESAVVITAAGKCLLLENSLYTPLLLWDLNQYLFSLTTTTKNPTRLFSFTKKRKKKYLFCSEPSRGNGTPQQGECHSQALSLGTTLSISASGTRTLKCICEHLCFISISCVHPLPRCMLKYQNSLKELVCYA